MKQVVFRGNTYNVKPDVAGESSCAKCSFKLGKSSIANAHGCISEKRMTNPDGTPYTNNCKDSKTYYEAA